ncbi:MAG TPA: hypothetical protein VF541_15160, partial [Longimicrobium sp.]
VGIGTAVISLLMLAFTLSPADPLPSPPPDVVLAEWTLAPDEWRAFSELQAKVIRDSISGHWVILPIVGGFVALSISGRLEYAVASAVLLPLAMEVPLRIIAHRRRTRMPRRGGSVVVRRNTVEIDGKTMTVRDHWWWLHDVRLLLDGPLPLMEVASQREWHDKHGKVSIVDKVIYVPVPHGRQLEAARAANQLLRGGLDDREDDRPETDVSPAAVSAS